MIFKTLVGNLTGPLDKMLKLPAFFDVATDSFNFLDVGGGQGDSDFVGFFDFLGDLIFDVRHDD